MRTARAPVKPELVRYVRGDLKLPDERQQALMDVLCGRIVR
jgi:hypothetical protein